MPEYRYDHVHLVSADPLKAAEFYETAFGARRVSVGKFPDGGARVELNLGGVRLLLRPPRNSSQTAQDNPRQRQGLEHFGLTTPNIEVAVADLKAKGIKFQDELATLPTGVKMAFIIAPDNVSIELMQV
jgi:lactoylglutathione lyase